jgi:hypothetical protein
LQTATHTAMVSYFLLILAIININWYLILIRYQIYFIWLYLNGIVITVFLQLQNSNSCYVVLSKCKLFNKIKSNKPYCSYLFVQIVQ